MNQPSDIKNRLDTIYDSIQPRSENPFNRDLGEDVFDRVDDFLKEYESSDYIQMIVDASPAVDAYKIGCLFDIFLWSTNDEGQKVQAWRKSSLAQGTEREVEIALCVSNTYPLIDLNEFLHVLGVLRIKYPALGSLYDHWKRSTQAAIARNEAEEKKKHLFERLGDKIKSFFRKD